MIQEDYNNLNMILDECRDLNDTVSNYTEPCTFHYHAPLLDQLDIALIRVIIFYFLKFGNPIEKSSIEKDSIFDRKRVYP